MTQPNTITRIAIVGGRHLVWPVAALLARQLPKSFNLILIEDQADSCALGPLSAACNHPYFARAGLTISQLINGAGATASLGVDHLDWMGPDSRFFDAPSGALPKINGVTLHQIMLRAAMLHDDTARLAHLLEPFRFPARLARSGKFAWPSTDPSSPLALLGPLLHLDEGAFSDFLERELRGNLAEHFSGKVTAAARNNDNSVQSITLTDGRKIAAELFIDLSGVLDPLLGLTSSDTASQYFLWDRIGTVMMDRQESGLPSHPTARAINGGLLLQTPLRGAWTSQFLYSANARAEQKASEICGADASSKIFAPIYNAQPWKGNIVRMGAAAARIGPYMSADWLLLFQQILHLSDLIPARRQMTSEAIEYNARHKRSYAQIRDRVLTPFVLNQRSDKFWTDMRGVAHPTTLSIRLGLFESRGNLPTLEGELFDEQSWIDLLIGFGVVPQRCDPLVFGLDMKRLIPLLGKLAADFGTIITNLPVDRFPATPGSKIH